VGADGPDQHIRTGLRGHLLVTWKTSCESECCQDVGVRESAILPPDAGLAANQQMARPGRFGIALASGSPKMYT